MKRPRSCLIALLVLVGILGVLLLAVGAWILLRGEGGLFVGGERVAVIRLEGLVDDPGPLLAAMERYGKDPRVRAMVLRIDTPGGAVGPTQEIFQAVRRWNRSKKIVASLGAVAASGGYYVACGAERIVANPGTITGSIGVVVYFANLEELLRKIGVQGDVIKSGAHKDMGSPHRGLTEQERALLQGVIDDVHDQFVEAVAESRKLPFEEIRAVADGRIFSGRQAQKLGLVDALGGLHEAVEMAARLGGIEGEPRIVEEPKRGLSLLDLLLGRVMGRVLPAGDIGMPFFAYLFRP